jgi:hypothetical protein
VLDEAPEEAGIVVGASGSGAAGFQQGDAAP